MTLRNALEELAGDVAPVDLGPRVERGVRRRRQRRVAGVAGAMTLVLVAAAVTLTNRRTDTAGLTHQPAATEYDLVWVDDLDRVHAVVDGADRVTDHVLPERTRRVDLSPDGGRLAVVHEDNTVEVMDLDGARRRIELPPGDPLLDPAIAWAPDSRRLAVTSTLMVPDPDARMPVRHGVWVVDTVTGVVTTVEHPNSGRRVSWSPDGTRLALGRIEEDMPAGIDLVTLDGELVRTLGRGEPWSLPSNHSWSPDGTRLLVSTVVRKGPGLLAVDVATGATDTVELVGGFLWWSDAEHLLWMVDETSQVVETTLGGQPTRMVFTFPGTTGYPPGTVAVRPAS